MELTELGKKPFLFFLIALLFLILSLPSLADDVSVKLDSSNGSTAFTVKDNSLNKVATIDSIGRVAIGVRTTATGLNGSVALGYQTQATAPSCFAMGWNTRATANCDTAFGASTLASGGYSTALGGRTTAAAGNCVAMGDWFTNTVPFSLGIGKGSSSSDPPDILLNPNGNSYLNAKTGNITIGTTLDAGSKLNVQGDLKLASMSAPPAAAGKVYFDSGTHRMNYHDGSQWIELDPAYTTKEVKSSSMGGGSVTNSTPLVIPIFTPTADIIITHMSFDAKNDAAGSIPFKVELMVGSGNTVRATFRREYIDYGTTGDSSYRTLDFAFPIPLKVAAGDVVTMKISVVSGPQSPVIQVLSVEYIELPF